MKKQLYPILLYLVFVSFLFAEGKQEGSAVSSQIGDISKINWNAPISMRDRVLGEKYILPQGWKEATKGITSIAFTNSGSLEYDPAMAKNMEIFKKLTGIEPIPMVVPESVLHTKQSAILRASSPRLDLVFCTTDTENYFDYIAAGWLEPCDVLYGKEIIEDSSPSDIAYLKRGDHFYGFTYIGGGNSLHYRKDLIAQAGFSGPPETWDDLLQYAIKLTRDTNGDGQPDIYGMCYAAGERYATSGTFDTWAVAMGHNFVKNGKVVYNSPEAVKALQLMADMRNKYRVVPQGVTTYDVTEVGQLIAAGKVAMGIAPGMNWQFVKNAPDIWPNYSMTYVPTSVKGGAHRVAGGPSQFTVSAFSNKKAAAMLYLDFLRSTEAAKNEWVLELNPRGNRGLWELPGMLDVPFARVSKELNEIAEIPIIPNKSEIIELLHPAISDALLGKKTAKEALDELQQLIDLIQD